MPEVRRVFSAGRMNKDIDERLLHPGEYRDALNVGVGTLKVLMLVLLKTSREMNPLV